MKISSERDIFFCPQEEFRIDRRDPVETITIQPRFATRQRCSAGKIIESDAENLHGIIRMRIIYQ